MSERIYYVEGEYVEASKATIPVSDFGLVRAYSTYECLRTYNYHLFEYEAHLKRLLTSCDKLLIPFPDIELRTILETLIEKNNQPHLIFKIYITGGTEGVCDSRLIIMADPEHSYPPRYFAQSHSVMTAPSERYLPEIKSTQYCHAMIVTKRANERGFDDVLYLDRDNNVLELTLANFFAIRENTLITPEEEILDGITRQVVMKVAEGAGFDVIAKKIPYHTLAEMDEVFLSSTIKKVKPIHRIDDMHFLKREKTKQILAAFNDYVDEECASLYSSSTS